MEGVISQIKLFNAGSGWRTITCVGSGAGEEMQVGQIEKKYPPYPDVWDFKVLT